MQIYPNQFAQHLNKSLPNTVLVFGEEPQQKMEALQRVRDKAQTEGFTERHSLVADAQFEWQHLIDAFQSMSLFAERQLIELEIPTGKPGTEGAKTLLEISEKANPDIVLVVHGGKIGKDVQNTKWFKALDNNGIFFVTRIRKNAIWKVEERRVVDKSKGLTSDQTITLTGIKPKKIGINDIIFACSGEVLDCGISF